MQNKIQDAKNQGCPPFWSKGQPLGRQIKIVKKIQYEFLKKGRKGEIARKRQEGTFLIKNLK